MSSVTDAGTSLLCEAICSGVMLVIELFVSQYIEVSLSERDLIDGKVICDSDWVGLCSISGIGSGLIASSSSGWLVAFSRSHRYMMKYSFWGYYQNLFQGAWVLVNLLDSAN
ncbi:5615_t:CDS:1 [Dentiscutata heterogama]|uniref:5615_t:CDS:1 n=1 Tax=Dentiscutata heterogama TaxID=1316150 RepID=A0ACA9LNK3_9GLOM|nr:5615_t:CDS:1 [Dentiscutata heterogama]